MIKLTQQTVKQLENKKIFLIEFSESYLYELFDEFDILSQIAGAFDDLKRNYGMHIFQGKKINVEPMNMLLNLNQQSGYIVLLIVSDYYREVYGKLKQYNLHLPVYFFINCETERELQYKTLLSYESLRSTILFRSGPHPSAYVAGMDFADNARALFEYMLDMGVNDKYRLVWQVKYPELYADRYYDVKNVEFQGYDWGTSDDAQKSEAYYRALFLAQYIFFTDAYGFARNCREDQIRVQLWHGCGFKTRVNFVPCEHRYEYNIVISPVYKKIHARIYGLREDQVMITGYPKQDWLFHPVHEEELRSLGIPKSSKYIFWLPTFRVAKDNLSQLNETSLHSDNGMSIISDSTKMILLNEILREYGVVLVIKLHPFQKREKINMENLSNIVLIENAQLVERDVQINQLLGWADALVSDYSSAAVDYLILDRPIAFTLDDVEEYEGSRGFVFDNIREWLPGMEIYTEDDFYSFVREIAVGKDSWCVKRKQIRKLMHSFGDDQSCRRVLDALGI